jgi:hypothetical protein
VVVSSRFLHPLLGCVRPLYCGRDQRWGGLAASLKL